MITDTVTINEYGQVTLPIWLFEKIGAKKGSPLTIQFDEQSGNFQFLSPTHQDEPKKQIKSGFGMLKTNIPAVPVDIVPSE
ncbi:hypothetical protein [Moraxella lacunata]|uniref:SpoVT-AbrB domain-containing protein n=1 Tax=Moraxella lacunata TaxID=477 RepID=A0A1V4GTG4_MORLA|nr:hypothetical protein [Moraxella lacunata]OPH35611.1 hypothetical protein B5J94_09455 [Moraxella lacunata]